MSLSDPGLLVDLRGAWLDPFFRDRFWHGRVSKFRGRGRDLVVAVAERALHRLHYVSGSLEVPGTLLDCFSLPPRMSLSVLALVLRSVTALLAPHSPTFPTCSVKCHSPHCGRLHCHHGGYLGGPFGVYVACTAWFFRAHVSS